MFSIFTVCPTLVDVCPNKFNTELPMEVVRVYSLNGHYFITQR